MISQIFRSVIISPFTLGLIQIQINMESYFPLLHPVLWNRVIADVSEEAWPRNLATYKRIKSIVVGWGNIVGRYQRVQIMLLSYFTRAKLS